MSLYDRSERMAPELKIDIENIRPVYLGDVGVLFEALAGDYSRFTKGRKLVVVRLETGSVVAFFQDAVTFAKVATPYVEGGVLLAQFVQALAKLWNRLSHIKPGQTQKRPRAIGMRTIRALAKIADQSESEITLTESSTETILRISPRGAREYVRTENERIDEIRRSLKDAFPTVSSFDTTTSILDRILASEMDLDDERVLQQLANLLNRSGYGFVIDLIADQLELRGRSRTADSLRKLRR